MLKKLIFIAPLIFSTPSFADNRTFDERADDCRQMIQQINNLPNNSIKAAACYGYIMGLSDMQFLSERYGLKFPWCLPKSANISIKQVIYIFVAYADKHPEKLHQSAVENFSWAMAEAFPCNLPPPNK